MRADIYKSSVLGQFTWQHLPCYLHSLINKLIIKVVKDLLNNFHFVSKW